MQLYLMNSLRKSEKYDPSYPNVFLLRICVALEEEQRMVLIQ